MIFHCESTFWPKCCLIHWGEKCIALLVQGFPSTHALQASPTVSLKARVYCILIISRKILCTARDSCLCQCTGYKAMAYSSHCCQFGEASLAFSSFAKNKYIYMIFSNIFSVYLSFLNCNVSSLLCFPLTLGVRWGASLKVFIFKYNIQILMSILVCIDCH